MYKYICQLFCFITLLLFGTIGYTSKEPQLASNASVETVVNESMQQHENLNPDYFDQERKITPKIRTRLLGVSQEYVKDLKQKLPGVILKDIVFVGALAGYGYNEKTSDIDIDIVADTSKVQGPPTLVENIVTLINNVWHYDTLLLDNKSLQITLVTKYALAGNYSLLNNRWITNPEHEKYHFSQADVVKSVQANDRKFIQLVKAYQADPKNFDCDRFEQLDMEFKQWRGAGLARDGASSFENVSYRAIKRLGVFDEMWSMTVACRNSK